MTVKYGFYDSLNGDRLYNANDISTMFEGLFSDGVFEFVDYGLRVDVNPGTMGVLVNPGRAWFNNLWIRNTSVLPLNILPSHMVLDRIDLVVLEFDFGITVRQNSITVLTGIPSATPIPPALANSLTKKQYALAQIYVKASATQIDTIDILNKIGSDDTPYAISLITPKLPITREVLTENRTYYIRTDGSDSNNGLTDSSGGAFLTIGKAFTTLSTIDKNGHNVKIKGGEGTFLEALSVTTGIGEGNVTLEGTLVLQETATNATVATGSGASAGTVTKIGAFAGNTYANYLAYFVTDAAYRVIDSHTDDVLTLVGTAPSSTTQDVIIYKQGTVVSSVTMIGNWLNMTNINVTGITRISSFSSCNISCNKYDGDLLIQTLASVSNQFSVLSTVVGGLALEVAYGSTLDSQYSKYKLGHNTAFMEVNTGGIMLFRYGSLIDGAAGANKATYGLHVLSGGLLEITNNATFGYCNVRNCDTGIAVDTNGLVTGLPNTTFSGNTTNLLINDGLQLVARNSAAFAKTADTALADITGLSLSLTAGLTYGFEATLYTTSNVAGGVKAAIAGTSTATSIIYECQTFNGTALSASTRATALGTAVGGVTAVTVAMMIIRGTIMVNAAGTITVQFAQNASNAAASSVLANSTFKAWAMP